MARALHIQKRSKQGFSLPELLAVLAIVTLVSMVVATGIPAAQHAYESAVNASNAQVMLTTGTTRLRDVLSVAKPDADVSVGSEITNVTFDKDVADFTPIIQFESYETGFVTTIGNTSDGIALAEQEWDVLHSSLGSSRPPVLLVPKAEGVKAAKFIFTLEGTGAAGEKLIAPCDGKGSEPSGGKSWSAFKVTGIKVKNTNDNTVAAKSDKELVIKTLAAPTAKQSATGSG